MENFVMFSDDEVREICGLEMTSPHHVEVTCGCTSHRYGDAVGTLRVFANGELEISCLRLVMCGSVVCWLGTWEGVLSQVRTHRPDKLTPAAFEKHSGRETSRNWRNNIWVIVDGEKVPLSKTVLLKYYNRTLRSASNKATSVQVCHRDEFVRCCDCNKQRRFHLRTKEECRKYHDAFRNAHWKCSDMRDESVKCEADEERASRRIYRGCLISPICKGCTSCVCFGCQTCRFSDCSCQTCIDFTRNVKA